LLITVLELDGSKDTGKGHQDSAMDRRTMVDIGYQW